MLPEVVAFNGRAVPEKVIAIGRAIGLAGDQLSVDTVVDALTHLNRKIGIPSLSQAGITEEQFDEIG